jgi:hypothetical protein
MDKYNNKEGSLLSSSPAARRLSSTMRRRKPQPVVKRARDASWCRLLPLATSWQGGTDPVEHGTDPVKRWLDPVGHGMHRQADDFGDYFVPNKYPHVIC